MSMSVWDIGSGLEYAGALGPRGLFPPPPPPTWRDRRFPQMLVEIPRFHRRARALLETAEDAPGSYPDETLRDFLARGLHGVLPAALHGPVVAAVWSSDPASRWTTRRATSSSSSSTTGCSASSGRRSGAPSPAAPTSTSEQYERRGTTRWSRVSGSRPGPTRPGMSPPTPVQFDRVLPAARQLFPLGEQAEAATWMGSRPCFPVSRPVIGPAPGQAALHGSPMGTPTGGSRSARDRTADRRMTTGATPFCDPAPYRAERFGS